MAHARVPVVGRGDQDGVEFLRLEQLAVIGELARVRRVLLGGVDLGAVDVADRDDIHVLVRLEPAHVVRPRSPQPISPMLMRSLAPTRASRKAR